MGMPRGRAKGGGGWAAPVVLTILFIIATISCACWFCKVCKSIKHWWRKKGSAKRAHQLEHLENRDTFTNPNIYIDAPLPIGYDDNQSFTSPYNAPGEEIYCEIDESFYDPNKADKSIYPQSPSILMPMPPSLPKL